VIQDKKVNGEACLNYRPDLMYSCGDEKMVLYVEVDEHQHKYHDGDYQCDEKRMSDLYDETPGSLVIFLRFNPDKYESPVGRKLITDKTKKLNLLLDTMNYVIREREKLADQALLHAIYICYDNDSDRLAKNIPKKLIYDECDLKKR
jgi:hypothetical protein